ncbi:ATP-binding cassette domain-containing protein [Gangjinia marincola]|uniref:ATP-binding cassette domain-containing protein n=1 Tax=Gangjinia marincola TaxID=578463 RepID=A0ABP3XZE0_9FLAO
MRVELDNVELYFDDKRILSGIYLKAETNRITGILGRNGCGKTSLLKILFGSLTPHNRLVRINNKGTLKPLYKSKIVSYLPQHDVLPRHIKIKIAFSLYHVSWNEFVREFPGFKQYTNSKIKHLSGGEQRVVEFYLCAKKPAQLLLLDEPFSHVAPVYVERFMDIIRTESNTKAIICTDHLYEHILTLANDLYYLQGGNIRLVKKHEELREFGYLV